MRALHLSISPGGGAGIAASRTVEALDRVGVAAELWSNDGGGSHRRLRSARWAHARWLIDSAPLRRYRRRKLFSVWSNGWLPSALRQVVRAARPDVVHLHWIGDGFVGLGDVGGFNAPVVWTLHDAWAFTGGCHYPGPCTRFRDNCGACPQLGSSSERDLSSSNLRRKQRVSGAIARWIVPSAWLGRMAAASAVVDSARLRHVPNGCDERVFRPQARAIARTHYRLERDELVLVAGALDLNERRKGAEFLPETMIRLRQMTGRRCVLLAFGKPPEKSDLSGDSDVRFLGKVTSATDVASVLAAADALLLPSLQDNLPNIAVEAQACGCPVIAFPTGGVAEIIESGRTGLLARETSAAALAEVTAEWLRQRPDETSVSARCRGRFEAQFSYAVHGRRMAEIYDEVVAEWTTAPRS